MYDVYAASLDVPFPESVSTPDGQLALPEGFARIGTASTVGREMMTPIVKVDLEGLGLGAVPGWRGEPVRLLAHTAQTIRVRADEGGHARYHEVHVVTEAESLDLISNVTFYGRWNAEPTSMRTFIFGPGADILAKRNFSCVASGA